MYKYSELIFHSRYNHDVEKEIGYNLSDTSVDQYRIPFATFGSNKEEGDFFGSHVSTWRVEIQNKR